MSGRDGEGIELVDRASMLQICCVRASRLNPDLNLGSRLARTLANGAKLVEHAF